MNLKRWALGLVLCFAVGMLAGQARAIVPTKAASAVGIFDNSGRYPVEALPGSGIGDANTGGPVNGFGPGLTDCAVGHCYNCLGGGFAGMLGGHCGVACYGATKPDNCREVDVTDTEGNRKHICSNIDDGCKPQ